MQKLCYFLLKLACSNGKGAVKKTFIYGCNIARSNGKGVVKIFVKM